MTSINPDFAPFSANGVLTAYRPLVGRWLIDLATECGWFEPGPGGTSPEILGGSQFFALTGPQRTQSLIKGAELDRMLQDYVALARLIRASLGAERLPRTSTLIRNLRWLGTMAELNPSSCLYSRS